MNTLIIGCGYLGRRVAAAWLQAGRTVHAMTRTEQRADELSAAGIRPVLGDVTAPGSIAALPECQTVLYAVGRDRTAAHSMREVYVNGLATVLDRLPKTVKRLLYISSTSVYGQSEGEWIDEESACEPSSGNGIICREAEQLLLDEVPSANILRVAGIYGPGRLLRRVESVRSGEPVGGNPDAFLNLIHVDDAVRGVLGCEERGRPGRTYLICDDRPVTRREYYSSLARELAAGEPRFDPGDAGSRGLNKRCRNGRMRQELGVELQFPTIATGLLDVLRGSGLQNSAAASRSV